jgi:hypothetical protein
MDIAVYGENAIKGNIIIMFGDGKGNFLRSTRLLVQPFGKNTVSGSMSAKDLDGDGIPEIVINTAEQTTGIAWQGSAFSVLKYDVKSNSLLDITTTYFTNSVFNILDSDHVFCNYILWRDLNNDGKDDLICSVQETYKFNDTRYSPRIFINKSNGKFEPAYHSGFNIIGILGSMLPIKIDGINKVVGIRNMGANITKIISVQIAE